MALVADAATAMAVDAAHASVFALATWASERLAIVATLDPESYDIMRGTMDSVVAALHGVADAQVMPLEQQGEIARTCSAAGSTA